VTQASRDFAYDSRDLSEGGAKDDFEVGRLLLTEMYQYIVAKMHILSTEKWSGQSAVHSYPDDKRRLLSWTFVAQLAAAAKISPQPRQNAAACSKSRNKHGFK